MVPESLDIKVAIQMKVLIMLLAGACHLAGVHLFVLKVYVNIVMSKLVGFQIHLVCSEDKCNFDNVLF